MVELLDVARSMADCRPGSLGEGDLERMPVIDETRRQTPFYASRRLRDELEDRDHRIGSERM